MRWNPGTATRLGRTRSVIRRLYASLSPEDRVSSEPEQVHREKGMLEVRSIPIREGVLPLRPIEHSGPAYDAIVSLSFSTIVIPQARRFIIFPVQSRTAPSKTELVGADGVPVCRTSCS